MEKLIWLMPLTGIAALAFAYWRATWINRQDPGDESMIRIAGLIRTGAMAFLFREYKTLAVFVLVVAAFLAYFNQSSGPGDHRHPLIAASFVAGALTSALAGFFGMRVATAANTRTAAAARTSLPAAFAVAFAGGSVMGMCVVGLGILGLSLLYLIYVNQFEMPRVISTITGFSMGASSIALFARVGGGIYTKAADIGADLVGKVESGLPEDDPRNPAVIADNVGDNVGDVAGMGADLFESYVGAIVSTMVLGLAVTVDGQPSALPIVLPMILAAIGILCSIGGTFLVKTDEKGNPQRALDAGSFGAAGVMALISLVVLWLFWPANARYQDTPLTGLGLFAAMAIGLGVGVAVGLITSHYCSIGKGPVNSIAEKSRTGYATNIIAGLAVGMESTTLPLLLIAAGIIGSFAAAGLYGVALAALGMLSTTGIQLAVDAYGPIADNAGGIAEMSHQESYVRARTDSLDAVGNTTAAIGKGFAIASAAMTALALFAAYMQESRLDAISLSLSNARVIAGLFIGAMLPYLFSSMALNAVGQAAMDMIEEVRRQFREIPGLLEGTADPDTAKCVDISTTAALRQMIVPGLLAVLSPVVIGFGLGAEALGGFLAGTTVSGVLLAIFMANAGGAWDNAKKSFEGDGFKDRDGHYHRKHSEAHKAAVVGDTVGDPFKDTAGPSLNILIKLISIIALIIAPLLAKSATTPQAPPSQTAVAAPARAS